MNKKKPLRLLAVSFCIYYRIFILLQAERPECAGSLYNRNLIKLNLYGKSI